MEKRPFVIGLTGGIASGKSIVANFFQALGIEIIDTDQLARTLVEPNQPALQAIIDYFSPAILQEDGKLNRGALRRLIFNDPTKRQFLETLLHPLIRQKISIEIKNVQSDYCLVVIPLLVEKEPNPEIERILVVDIEPARQKSLLQKRDQLSDIDIEKILKAQANRATRLAKAEDIIHNTGSLEELKAQVLALHGCYLEMSKNRLNGSNAKQKSK
jgi:dephospho-CoA kinase